MSKKYEDQGFGSQPVYVIESIPVGGEHKVSARDVAAEGIPIPDHLRVYPELGRGGMGRIHPATDRNLLRHVALKRLDQELAKEPFYRDGFVAEAQMTGQLEHPNIVPVHELQIAETGVPYFTMKLVQGVGLDKWLKSPERPVGSTERLQEGLEIFLKVCEAVAYAHYRGVIHRDLKPENIMIGTFGQVYVMDWGLARLTKTQPASGKYAQMEAPGPVGTPGFMSPEQARGEPNDMDERSDVFGLGAVLYEMVSGRIPYGRYDRRIMERMKRGEVVPIDEATRGVALSRDIKAIVDKAVSPNPGDRYQSVTELEEAVRRFLRGGLHLPSKTFQPGEVIIREGEPGDAAYIIVNGTCRAVHVVGGEKQTLATMEQGSVFGEMALLLDEPRAATVEAVDAVTVLVLDKQTMTEGLGIDDWTGALVRALAKRFRDLEQQVRASGIKRG